LRLLDILIGSDGLNRFLLSLFGTKNIKKHFKHF